MTSLPPPPALEPIDVGPVRIDCPVVLAPMTGVTDMPFRTLVRRYGSGLNVTEMIASPAMIRETRQSLQKAEWNSIEEPVSMQLVGCDPHSMAEAARLNEDRGAAPAASSASAAWRTTGLPRHGANCFGSGCPARRPWPAATMTAANRGCEGASIAEAGASALRSPPQSTMRLPDF